MFRGSQLSKNQKGKKRKALFAFLVLVNIFFFSSLTLFPETNIQANEAVSVGVVNVTFLMENAPQATIASAKLKEKFLPQEKKLAKDLEEINKLAKDLELLGTSTTISVDEKRQKERELRSRKRARSRLLQDFREELRFARNEALDDVQKEVFRAIDEVREREDIDIVLQDYVSANKRVDITPLVLGYLKKKLNDTNPRTSGSNNQNTNQRPSESKQ